MSIVKREGTITKVIDLTETSKEVTVTLHEAIPCLPGSFINLFMDIDGRSIRRAYSVVSTDEDAKTITVSIRHTLRGVMTPQFWKSDIIGRSISVMGPMGKNTADKLSHPTVYLFAYGIGAGVIKAIATHVLTNPNVTSLTITTGSRNENDIVYKAYFDEIQKTYSYVSVRYVISNPLDEHYPFKGYVQDNIEDMTFTDADIYMCGQEKACDLLIQKIHSKNPENVSYFIEAFH